MATIELTPALVEEYLAIFGDEAYVGKRTSTHYCPLANALRKAGIARPVVGLRQWYDLDNTEWKPSIGWNTCSMPAWGTAFIERVDRGKSYSHIKASTARRILKEVLAEVGAE